VAFDSFSEFLQMGRHGFYVWSTYGISTIILLAIAWQTWQQKKQVRNQLAKRFIREQEK
jgi:heme exporter protein D